MSQQELLIKVIKVLEKNKLDYMITGSMASSLQGEPRSTHDIDLIIDIDISKAEKLLDSFPPPDYYLDKDGILDAIKRKSMFNLLEVESGDKVDFWILTDDEFDKSRFARKCSEKVMRTNVKVSSPEDTILSKLRWAKLSGGSEKQFIDALRVYEVQFDKLDIKYIENWVKKLNVTLLWKRLKKEAKVI
jgi:hypothetical protein